MKLSSDGGTCWVSRNDLQVCKDKDEDSKLECTLNAISCGSAKAIVDAKVCVNTLSKQHGNVTNKDQAATQLDECMQEQGWDLLFIMR